MAKKIITVFGATGAQGGSVVNTFITDPKLKDEWQVRGVTRDVSKENAVKLSEKGVEMVSAGMDDKAALVKAMAGSDVVYALTDYWNTMDRDKEIQQGKNLADAAKEANVGLFIYSTLKNVAKLSGGKLAKVYHFDSKAEVADYTRSLDIPAVYFMPGFYMSNFSGGMLRQSPPDNAWTLSLPIPGTAKVPMFDTARDTGKFIKAIVLHRDEVLGREVLGATNYMTCDEIVEAFKKLYPEAGKTARYFEMPKDMYIDVLTTKAHMPEFAAEELYENMQLMHQFGYYFGDSLDWSHSLVEDKLTTWEEFAKSAKEFQGLH